MTTTSLSQGDRTLLDEWFQWLIEHWRRAGEWARMWNTVLDLADLLDRPRSAGTRNKGQSEQQPRSFRRGGHPGLDRADPRRCRRDGTAGDSSAFDALTGGPGNTRWSEMLQFG